MLSIFEKMKPFTPVLTQDLEQGKVMVGINLGNRGLINMSAHIYNVLKFEKISRKDILCMKMKKKWRTGI